MWSGGDAGHEHERGRRRRTMSEHRAEVVLHQDERHRMAASATASQPPGVEVAPMLVAKTRHRDDHDDLRDLDGWNCSGPTWNHAFASPAAPTNQHGEEQRQNREVPSGNRSRSFR